MNYDANYLIYGKSREKLWKRLTSRYVNVLNLISKVLLKKAINFAQIKQTTQAFYNPNTSTASAIQHSSSQIKINQQPIISIGNSARRFCNRTEINLG